MECGVSVDVAEYCRELRDLNAKRRPMEERYFFRRYKCGTQDGVNLLCYPFQVTCRRVHVSGGYVHRSVKITAKLRSPIGDFSHLDFDHRSVIVDPRLKSPICNHSTGVARVAISYSKGISL